MNDDLQMNDDPKNIQARIEGLFTSDAAKCGFDPDLFPDHIVTQMMTLFGRGYRFGLQDGLLRIIDISEAMENLIPTEEDENG